MDVKKKIYKSNSNKMICGVCAGIADYLDVDPTLIRLIWAGVTFFAGAGLLAYIVAAIIMPQDDGIIDMK